MELIYGPHPSSIPLGVTGQTMPLVGIREMASMCLLVERSKVSDFTCFSWSSSASFGILLRRQNNKVVSSRDMFAQETQLPVYFMCVFHFAGNS